MQGLADKFNELRPSETAISPNAIIEMTVETNDVSSNRNVTANLAGFLHRSYTSPAPISCESRVRLTPSGPSKVGSIWFREPISISNGFDTFFTFQITDHSRECTLHKDQYFSLIEHQSCSVHGGDGFAFVLQNNADTISAVGGDGQQLGYGGMKNSIAVAFDMFSNPGVDLMGVDNVSVHSRGRESNSAGEDGLLGVPKAVEIADGKVHFVRIQYHNNLVSKYLSENMVASDSLLPYLRDNGEQKRVGTLVVFLDDGVLSNTPLLSMPINLSLVLDMPADQAYVGFTASTGRFFEKHDILSWYFCDQEPCTKAKKANFHFHTESNFSLASLRTFTPGSGYGGSDGSEGFPTRQKSPDSSAWRVPVEHFSSSNNNGLATGAAFQTPPETYYRRN